MIREKIFRIHRYKSSSSSSSAAAAENDVSAQKFDFTFSNIQAIQVPKGWDKVCLSLVSSESGKTARKTGKLPVKNGACQWTETFLESIWISNADSSKDMDEYLFKFLVAAGSSKSSVLGEATINLAAFLSSQSPMLVSLPLKKCNHGTILQVEVRCLTPKTNPRDEKWKNLHSHKDENVDHDDLENGSEVSDSTTNLSRPRELSSRETSFSASVSRYSFDSVDDSVWSQSDRNGGNSVILRQDSIESNDSASYGSHGSVKSIRALQSPFTKENQSRIQREEFRKLSNANDSVVQELEAEARMWEQNARKLSVELERLRKQLSDQNVSVMNLNIEVARSHSECHGLTQEIEQLKLQLEESCLKQNDSENLETQETAWSNIQTVFKDEMRIEKEENENLFLQLKKTQESNIELITVLQEMEDTIDKQKLEMMNSQFVLESRIQDKNIEVEIEQDLKNRVLKEFVAECNNRLAAKEEKIKNLESDCNELTEENLDLLCELKELRKSDVSNEKNVDELRSLESENNQTELVKHLSDLQEENLYFLQRVSGLEAQLRYLTDKTESSSSELQYSESKAVILESQIRRLEEEIELQKVDMKQKLLDMQKQFSEAQEQCTNLNRLNMMMQATTESLIEEYDSLQKFNGEIKEQKIKLKEHCLALESESRKYRDSCCDSLIIFENMMNGESKRRSIINELESRLRLCELENLRLVEENTLQRMRLQKVAGLQNEVLQLRVSIRDITCQNQLLEASFKSVSGDYEELRCERNSLVEKISSMEKAMLEAEDCRRKKNVLEEKILRLEGDIIARDVLYLQDAETKNEITQIKIANSQLLMKIKCLEDVREDLERRAEYSEQEQEQEQKQKSNCLQVQVMDKDTSLCRRCGVNVMDSESRIDLLENELAKALKANDVYKMLDAELQEIQERYLHISLKYAEVEAEREELVMKLKGFNV